MGRGARADVWLGTTVIRQAAEYNTELLSRQQQDRASVKTLASPSLTGVWDGDITSPGITGRELFPVRTKPVPEMLAGQPVAEDEEPASPCLERPAFFRPPSSQKNLDPIGGRSRR